MRSVLYLLYTSDLPTFNENIVDTFVDDPAIVAIGNNNTNTTEKLQTAIDEMQRWAIKCDIKLNETKSVDIDFTNRAQVNIHQSTSSSV